MFQKVKGRSCKVSKALPRKSSSIPSKFYWPQQVSPDSRHCLLMAGVAKPHCEGAYVQAQEKLAQRSLFEEFYHRRRHKCRSSTMFNWKSSHAPYILPHTTRVCVLDISIRSLQNFADQTPAVPGSCEYIIQPHIEERSRAP